MNNLIDDHKFTNEELATWRRVEAAQRARRAAAYRANGQRPLPMDLAEEQSAEPAAQRPLPQSPRRPLAPRPLASGIDWRRLLLFDLITLLLYGVTAPMWQPTWFGLLGYGAGALLIVVAATWLAFRLMPQRGGGYHV